MQASELKEYLYEDIDRIFKTLEHFGFHDVWQNTSEEVRCALPGRENNTSVSVKIQPQLFATSYSDDANYRGDIFGLIETVADKKFKDIMWEIHNLFGIPMVYKEGKSVDLLKDLRKYKRGYKDSERENVKYTPSVLKNYIHKPHKTLIEEAISPKIVDMFDVCFDPERSRIVFPHYDWEETDKIVGLQGRTTMSSEVAKELNVPKYWNYIPYIKGINLYGWHLAKDNIKEKKMMIIFEGEKSTLKHFTQERGKGFSVSLGGHEITKEQIKFIINNTSEDVEIVIAFDKDIMLKQGEVDKQNLENNENKLGELEETCRLFSKYRKTSYIYDKFNLLEGKDSPIDRGVKIFSYLLKYRIEV